MGIERRERDRGDADRRPGYDAATPVAVVMDATTPAQRVWTGRLDTLGDADVESPAVIVIGAVAAFADAAASFAAERFA